ncbi:hypothetical protein PTNB85_06139 [Pyrenophora teres f. teres]|nr:hypothetical protein HRS9139_08819 [Pyrenophora teres f. teres]KAE8834806.1 hypothetical protein PTNB85_06139 [Pyrenophora teres f. teres]KAE8843716.1 hypothetical protein HRS9122_04819 [Pyrenophora teres f. teres]KAE8861094.1 hypothetical protein PTNB29_06189 [Pyrenophora teres f. teres]
MLLPSTLLALVFALLPAPRASAADHNVHTSSDSLVWGPYRPNLYLGLRPRVPKSILAGLMWGKLEDVERTLRHNVNQSEGMARYSWTAYHTREGGRQIIEDVGNKINLTTEFVKYSEGQSAGNWGLRIRGIPRPDAAPDQKTTVVFYVGMEAMGTCASCKLEAHTRLGDGDDTAVHAVDIELAHPVLGSAGIQIGVPVNNEGTPEAAFIKTMNVTEDRLWQAKYQTEQRTQSGPTDLVLNTFPGMGNMQLVQLVCHGGFEFDILYSSGTATRAMTSASLTTDIESTIKSFQKSFVSIFKPKAPFITDPHLAFAENVFSNLLGGLGYFSGTTKVDTAKKAIYAETTGNFWLKTEDAKKHTTPEMKGPYELLTHTPSRSMFPRGFLWDEGFHLLPIIEWDADLALEVIRDWLLLMDNDGWIAREQVLGAEAESATPGSAVTQYPHIANPPTMFLVISKFIDMLRGTTKYYGRESVYLSQSETGKALVAKLYPLLKRHYEWFRKSQSGDVEAHSIPTANLNEGYRWRGRTPGMNLASGLDDYPRAEPPDITELHLDALCWVGVMARTLEQIALFTESTHDAFTYQNHVRGIKSNLELIHWEDAQNAYCDAVVRKTVHTHACHKGYVSLFPLLTGFLDASHPHLRFVLDLIRNPNHLWTDHGVRSLSEGDKNYGVGDNYWRSPIWININYLILERLLSLAQTPGPFQQRCQGIYIQLRRNIVETVYTSYLDTGFVWEQYDPVGGHGQRGQQFTGWTALVVKIMSMPDLEADEGVREMVKGYYEKAKKKAAGNKGVGAGAGSLVVVVGVVGFVYVNRRRFAGVVRGLRRHNN